MRIVHVCLEGPYTDYWSYQENILPKYNAIQNHEVSIITTTKKYDDSGKIIDVGTMDYFLKDGQHIYRIDYFHYFLSNNFSFFKKYKFSDLLECIAPEFIMVHGIGNISARQIANYCDKHEKCKVVSDTHIYEEMEDFHKGILSKIRNFIIKRFNKKMKRYYQRIYGISESCIDTAVKYWGIDRNQMKLLPLGCDDLYIKNYTLNDVNEIRKKYDICDNDFLIVTGGKINSEKKTSIIEEAVIKNNHPNVKLIIFGNFIDDNYEKIVRSYVDGKKIKYIGFLDIQSIYELYGISNLAVFPGTQSALWQQAIGSGLPTIFRYWNKIEYLDLGGNCLFVRTDNADDYLCLISKIIENRKMYDFMKNVAEKKGKEFFSYSSQAVNILES